jgi:hypothetical protein
VFPIPWSVFRCFHIADKQRLAIVVDLIVRHDSQRLSHSVELVDLIFQDRRGSEVLQITIRDVGEIDVAVSGIHRDIVERIELASIVVVDKL